MVTACCWRPMSTMPSDCLARSPAPWVVSIGGRIWGTGSIREESILDKGNGVDTGSEATQASAGLDNLQVLLQPRGLVSACLLAGDSANQPAGTQAGPSYKLYNLGK